MIRELACMAIRCKERGFHITYVPICINDFENWLPIENRSTYLLYINHTTTEVNFNQSY